MNGINIDVSYGTNAINFKIDSDDLKNLEDYEIEYLKNLPHDSAFWEIFESLLCNGWEMVEYGLFGGLVINDGSDDYYDAFYETKNAVDELLSGNTYTFYKA